MARPKLEQPNTASSGEEAAIMSAGGPMAPGNAFQQGQTIGVRRKSS